MEQLLVLLVFIFLVGKFLGSTFGSAVIVSGILTWIVSLFGVGSETIKIVFGVTLFIIYGVMQYIAIIIIYGEHVEKKADAKE